MKTLDLAPDKRKSTHSILKQCIFCKGETEIVMYTSDYVRWQGGVLIQKVFGDQPSYVRELIINGTHDECFDMAFTMRYCIVCEDSIPKNFKGNLCRGCKGEDKND